MKNSLCFIIVGGHARDTGNCGLTAIPVEIRNLASYIASAQVNGPALPESALHRSALNAFNDQNWAVYLNCFGSATKLQAFISVEHLMNEETYWDRLKDVWMSVDHADESFAFWEFLFFRNREIEPAHLMMNLEEKKTLAGLPDFVTIYRGQQHRSTNQAFCWTLSRKVAWFFAVKYRVRYLYWRSAQPVRLLREAIVPEAAILAYFEERNEQTVILRPDAMLTIHETTFRGRAYTPGRLTAPHNGEMT